jgi:hypothetical protein
MPTRINLSNGFWIDVKDVESMQDREDVHSYAVDGISADRKTLLFNVVKHQIATVAARVKNWSVEDGDGKVIPWPHGKPFADRVKVVKSLDGLAFDVVSDELVAHLNALDAAREKAKNGTADGGTDSASSSPSAS